MECPCKINLGLTVGPRLASRDGLHQIYSLFLPIRLGAIVPDPHPEDLGAFTGDSIEISPSRAFHFTSENQIQGPDSVIQAFEEVSERGNALSKNLMVRAARLIQEVRLADRSEEISELPVEIHIEKRVPPGTGLGAGSANAARVLRFAIGQHWISYDQARQIAPALGADVSFFLEAKPALVSGTGERIQPVQAGALFGVLCFPGIFVSTAEAYSRLKRPLQQSEDAKLGSLLSDSDWHAVAAGEWDRLAHRVNDFEAPVFAMHPELADIKSSLTRTGAVYCSLSGSGSALYGLYSNGERAMDALDTLRSQHPELPFETFALWE